MSHCYMYWFLLLFFRFAGILIDITLLLLAFINMAVGSNGTVPLSYPTPQPNTVHTCILRPQWFYICCRSCRYRRIVSAHEARRAALYTCDDLRSYCWLPILAYVGGVSGSFPRMQPLDIDLVFLRCPVTDENNPKPGRLAFTHTHTHIA